jgi:hypothetical protein
MDKFCRGLDLTTKAAGRSAPLNLSSGLHGGNYEELCLLGVELRHHVTNRKVAGSIPDMAIHFFSFI